MAGLRGTPVERREQKAARRRANQISHVRALGMQAHSGHDKVKAATRAALAASGRMTDDASRALALALAQVVEQFDVQPNWRA